jgi:hypothetical protein
MPDSVQGVLRVNSEGGWPVRDFVGLFQALERAYNGLVVLELMLPPLDEDERGRRYRRSLPLDFFYRPEHWPDLEIRRLIRPSEHLKLQKAQLASPGVLEFLGSLNPLEFIRKSLDDRHRRRQDRDYREGHENRRLYLENLLLENEVMRGRMELGQQQLDVSDLTPVLDQLVYEPMLELEAYEGSGIISTDDGGQEGDAPVNGSQAVEAAEEDRPDEGDVVGHTTGN